MSTAAAAVTIGTAAAAVTAAFACGVVLTPLVRDYAVRRGLLDHGLTSRKIHGRPVPRLGGIAIVTAFFAPFIVLLPVGVPMPSDTERSLVLGLIVGGLAIAALGVYDDVRGACASSKFVVQFGVAALAWGCGYRIDAVSLPLLGLVDLGPFGFPLTLVWIAGVINALNLIDGLDGLAAGVSLVVLVTLFSIASGRGDLILMLVAAALAGAVLAFLVFNFKPASVFMGDTGSMFIGFVLAIVSIQASKTSSSAVALLVPVTALGYPVADTLLAMARRAARGVPMFAADREHIHHRLLACGFSHGGAVLTLCAVSVGLCWAAKIIFTSSDLDALLATALVACGVAVALRWLGFLDWKKLRELAEARHRNVTRRQRVVEIARQLERAADPEAIGASLAEIGPALNVDHVALRAMERSWSFTPVPKPDLHIVRYDLRGARATDDVLEVGWTHGTPQANRETEIAIEELCPHVREALRRVGRAAAVAPVETGADGAWGPK